MPYISLKTTAPIDDRLEEALTAALGRAITAIPGKTEAYLMVEVEGGCRLRFAGKQRPLAMIDIKILGHAKPEDFSRMTGELCKICDELLGVSPDGVYVTYGEFENWGWNGKNF